MTAPVVFTAVTTAKEHVTPESDVPHTGASETNPSITEGSRKTEAEANQLEQDASSTDAGPGNVAECRDDAVPETTTIETKDSSRAPEVLLSISQRKRLIRSDFRLFRALDVRGSENCPVHGNLGTGFCTCKKAREAASLCEQIAIKSQFVRN